MVSGGKDKEYIRLIPSPKVSMKQHYSSCTPRADLFITMCVRVHRGTVQEVHLIPLDKIARAHVCP